MSENENNTPIDDPWATDGENAAPEDGINWDEVGKDAAEQSDLDDLFDGAEISFEEEESGEEVVVYDAGDTYSDPLEVGLQDKMWVPVRLVEVAFKPKHTPRFGKDVCVAIEDLGEGKKRVQVPFDNVEEALKNGATEVIREIPLPYFITYANHVAPEFKQRRYNYEVEVPAITVKKPPFRQNNSGKTGFANRDGYSLRKATGVTEKGEKINAANTVKMNEMAEKMTDKIVMARVSVTTKSKSKPQFENGKPITVLVDTENGKPITVRLIEKQKGEEAGPNQYVVNDGSGTLWEGNEALLISAEPGVYAIRDSGETSSTFLKDEPVTNDYINPPFLEVPDLDVTVTMGDGSVKTEGKITYRTVGAIVQGKQPGITVDVLLNTGKTVTAVWLGTEWREVPTEKEETGGGLDEFAGVSDL